ncbi:Histone deacetylase hda1 [Rhizina undulata]
MLTGNYQLQNATGLDSEALEEINVQGAHDSVYYNQRTFISAKISCGGAIEACRAVVTGAVKNSIAVIRPPGHHAEPCKAMGFSMFNNVSVAAKVMQAEYPEKCRRILILDWDVHHDNGTQSAFYDGLSVLYISIHRYCDEFYPGGAAGDYKMCGEGGGLGMNFNVPWPWSGIGDGDYIYTFQRVVLPIASEFNPDLVIIHLIWFNMLIKMMQGGYNLQSISNFAVAVTKVLMGELPRKLHDEVATQVAFEVVNKCGLEQSQFWHCLKGRQFLPEDQGAWRTDRFNELIQLHQALLHREHNMTPLPILSEIISPSFKARVFATPDYERAGTIIFVVHDPYVTHSIVTHNNFYVAWAVKARFAVIDANIPRALTGSEYTNYVVSQKAGKLCTELWDNYLELADATNIFFIGIGEAFASEQFRQRPILKFRSGITILGKVLSNRFGVIVESSSENIQGVLQTSFDDVIDWISGRI